MKKKRKGQPALAESQRGRTTQSLLVGQRKISPAERMFLRYRAQELLAELKPDVVVADLIRKAAPEDEQGRKPSVAACRNLVKQAWEELRVADTSSREERLALVQAMGKRLYQIAVEDRKVSAGAKVLELFVRLWDLDPNRSKRLPTPEEKADDVERRPMEDLVHYDRHGCWPEEMPAVLDTEGTETTGQRDPLAKLH